MTPANDQRTVLSLFRGVIQRPSTMREITVEVAQKHQLNPREMRAGARERRVAHPRQEAMWRIYQTGRYSYPQIARFLGYKDHTTIIHGVREHERRRAERMAAE